MLKSLLYIQKHLRVKTKQWAKKGLVTVGVYVCLQSAPVSNGMDKSITITPLVEKSVMVPLDDVYRNKLDVLTINLHPPKQTTGEPAEEHYTHWDSDLVHPYPWDLFSRKDTVTLPLDDLYQCNYVHPVNSKVNSGFGYRNGGYHFGVDMDIEYGDPIYNSFDGKVRVAKYDESYGFVVVVRHYNGLETVYGHLSKLAVEEDDEIRAGKVVGLGGNTGRSTGSHLHYEVRFQGQPLDPAEVISFEHQTLKNDTLQVYRSNRPYLAVFDGKKDVSS